MHANVDVYIYFTVAWAKGSHGGNAAWTQGKAASLQGVQMGTRGLVGSPVLERPQTQTDKACNNQI